MTDTIIRVDIQNNHWDLHISFREWAPQVYYVSVWVMQKYVISNPTYLPKVGGRQAYKCPGEAKAKAKERCYKAIKLLIQHNRKKSNPLFHIIMNSQKAKPLPSSTYLVQLLCNPLLSSGPACDVLITVIILSFSFASYIRCFQSIHQERNTIMTWERKASFSGWCHWLLSGDFSLLFSLWCSHIWYVWKGKIMGNYPAPPRPNMLKKKGLCFVAHYSIR